MKLTFGQLITELPDGWTDGSILKFADTSQPMKEGSAQPSLVLNRAANEGGPLPEILEAQSAQLTQQLLGFDVVQRSSTKGRHGPVHYQEHRFGEEGQFTQLLCLTAIGDFIYIVTGTANTSDYAALRPKLLKAATALTVAKR